MQTLIQYGHLPNKKEQKSLGSNQGKKSQELLSMGSVSAIY